MFPPSLVKALLYSFLSVQSSLSSRIGLRFPVAMRRHLKIYLPKVPKRFVT